MLIDEVVLLELVVVVVVVVWVGVTVTVTVLADKLTVEVIVAGQELAESTTGRSKK